MTFCVHTSPGARAHKMLSTISILRSYWSLINCFIEVCLTFQVICLGPLFDIIGICSNTEIIQYCSLCLILAIAEVYKNEGNEEYKKGDFGKAIYFYTEGIKVNCKDEELKAKLHSNRAIAHFYLGENFLFIYLLINLI